MAGNKKLKNLTTAAAEAPSPTMTPVIKQPETRSVGLEITGTLGVGMIQNKFAQKSIEEMLRKHLGFSTQRERKVVRDVLANSRILNSDVSAEHPEGRICVPPTAFKMAMLSASAMVKTLSKNKLKTLMFIAGNSIPITYESQNKRMDVVRTSGMNRTPDIRFRYEYMGWKARLVIKFGDLLSVQTVIDLLSRAGTVGVGEWRPEKNGINGTFEVTRVIESKTEMQEVLAECSHPIKPYLIPDWALEAEIDPVLLAKAFGEDALRPGEDDDAPEGVETKRGDEVDEDADADEEPVQKPNGKHKNGDSRQRL